MLKYLVTTGSIYIFGFWVGNENLGLDLLYIYMSSFKHDKVYYFSDVVNVGHVAVMLSSTTFVHVGYVLHFSNYLVSLRTWFNCSLISK